VRILAVSPHYDDVPLSLGQSLIDGALAGHEVDVGVVFGRSNFTRWFHPLRRRWPLATAIRRVEETIAARRFGYRLRVGDREEAMLRLGTSNPESYLDAAFDPATSPELEPVVRLVARWASEVEADLVLCPLGIGDHVDHLLAAEAGIRLAATGLAVGHYADRPYASFVSDDEIAARAPAGRTVRDASGPVTAAKVRRLWYPSQFDQLFLDALHDDERTARRELLFLPPGAAL
jgi:LmbE family N-acetylglucosaminyl deacetylase